MPTTIQPAPLTVTISEQINLNGQQIDSSNALVIDNIKQVDKRLMTIPSASEINVITFEPSLAPGSFIPSDVKYMRFTNKDDTNFLRIRLKKVFPPNRIKTLGVITPGSTYSNGTYTNIPLTGGSGSGAKATIVVNGQALVLHNLVGGSGYVDGTYDDVTITGGTGTGATASIVVSGGVVTSCTIESGGPGYTVGDTLSTLNTNLGGTGSGFHVQIQDIQGGVTSVTITDQGTGYVHGDSLAANDSTIGSGSGFSVLVDLVESIVDIVDKRIEAGKSLILGDTKFSTDSVDESFDSFVDVEEISAQADTNPVDMEYFVASI